MAEGPDPKEVIHWCHFPLLMQTIPSYSSIGIKSADLSASEDFVYNFCTPCTSWIHVLPRASLRPMIRIGRLTFELRFSLTFWSVTVSFLLLHVIPQWVFVSISLSFSLSLLITIRIIFINITQSLLKIFITGNQIFWTRLTLFFQR